MIGQSHSMPDGNPRGHAGGMILGRHPWTPYQNKRTALWLYLGNEVVKSDIFCLQIVALAVPMLNDRFLTASVCQQIRGPVI